MILLWFASNIDNFGITVHILLGSLESQAVYEFELFVLEGANKYHFG